MNDQDAILQQGIADILLPVPPDSMSILSGLTILVFVISLVVISLLWYWRHSKRAVALRMLKTNALQSLEQGDFCTTAYCIAAAIRYRLGTNRLDSKTTLPDRLRTYQQRWDSFLAMLQSGRYARAACSRESVLHLYTEAGFWLRRWP